MSSCTRKRLCPLSVTQKRVIISDLVSFLLYYPFQKCLLHINILFCYNTFESFWNLKSLQYNSLVYFKQNVSAYYFFLHNKLVNKLKFKKTFKVVILWNFKMLYTLPPLYPKGKVWMTPMLTTFLQSWTFWSSFYVTSKLKPTGFSH